MKKEKNIFIAEIQKSAIKGEFISFIYGVLRALIYIGGLLLIAIFFFSLIFKIEEIKGNPIIYSLYFIGALFFFISFLREHFLLEKKKTLRKIKILRASIKGEKFSIGSEVYLSREFFSLGEMEGIPPSILYIKYSLSKEEREQILKKLHELEERISLL